MDIGEARRTFRDVRVAYIASLNPDGGPHVVPLWFVWLPDAIYLTSRKGSQLCRNLRRDDRVGVTMERGTGWTEQAGILVRGRAIPLDRDHADTKKALSAWFEKYRSELASGGFAAYTQQVREPVVLTVAADRISSWIHARRRATPGPGPLG